MKPNMKLEMALNDASIADRICSAGVSKYLHIILDDTVIS